MIELNYKIKKALLDINFVKRYEELSNTFNDEKTPDTEDVLKIAFQMYEDFKKEILRN